MTLYGDELLAELRHATRGVRRDAAALGAAPA
jgi:hypothetical protein